MEPPEMSEFDMETMWEEAHADEMEEMEAIMDEHNPGPGSKRRLGMPTPEASGTPQSRAPLHAIQGARPIGASGSGGRNAKRARLNNPSPGQGAHATLVRSNSHTALARRALIRSSTGASIAADEDFMLDMPATDSKSVAIVTGSGRRCFLRLKPEKPEESPVAAMGSPSSSSSSSSSSSTSSAMPMSSPPQLLRTSVRVLNRELAEERREERRRAAEAEEARHHAELAGDADVVDGEAALSSAKKKKATTGGQQLWVNKYRPRRFTQLLSDAAVNRQVLSWVKTWDADVFGTASTGARGATSTRSMFGKAKATGGGGGGGGGNFKNRGSKFDKNNKYKKKRFGNKYGAGGDDDDDLAPVLLLSGPPGTGKTTLAHVIAEHAGYNIVEVNASDDRSQGVLLNRVVSAMENTALNFTVVEDPKKKKKRKKKKRGLADDEEDEDKEDEETREARALAAERASRPTLVVLDEIDGAMGSSGDDGRGAIHALVEYFSTGKVRGRKVPKAPGRKSDDDGAVAGWTRPRRPIICICNDAYGPALRPLRQIAQVLTLDPIRETRLTQRIKEVGAAEKTSMTNSAVSALVSHSRNDVRACLHTLQFLRENVEAGDAIKRKRAQQQQKEDRRKMTMKPGWVRISESEVKAFRRHVGDVGGEAPDKDLFAAMRAVFARPPRRTGGSVVGGLSPGGADGSLRVLDVWHRMRTVMWAAPANRLLDGLHQNMLSVGYSDATMSKTVAALEALGDAGMFQRKATATQAMDLLGYLPMAPMALHLLCQAASSSSARLRMQYPRQAYEALMQRRKKREILESLHEGIAGAAFLRAASSSSSSSSSSSEREIDTNTCVLPSKTAVALDLVPFLLDVIQPAARPSKSNLLSIDEKRRLRRVVDIMLTHGLSYQQVRGLQASAASSARRQWGTGGGGAYVAYVLQPEIHLLVNYDVNAAAEGAGAGALKVKRMGSGSGDAAKGLALSRQPRPQLPDNAKRYVSRCLHIGRLERSVSARLSSGAQQLVGKDGAKKDGKGAAWRKYLKPKSAELTTSKEAAATAAKVEAATAAKSSMNFLQRARAMHSRKKRGKRSSSSSSDAAGSKKDGTAASEAAGSSGSKKRGSPSPGGSSDSGSAMEQNLYFKFKEGYTNAVRRHVTIAEFW